MSQTHSYVFLDLLLKKHLPPKIKKKKSPWLKKIEKGIYGIKWGYKCNFR